MADWIATFEGAEHAAFLKFAVALAKEAGGVIRSAYVAGTPPSVQNKQDNAVDLVTLTDQAVEKMVVERLNASFPTYKFIGEETVAAGVHCELTDAPTVIVDPIDGTTNFVHRFPFVCISIALCVKKASVVGVIYNPIMEELYVAHVGHGAFMNGQRLPLHHNNDPLSLRSALLVSEAGHDRSAHAFKPKMATFDRLLSETGVNLRGIRCTGSGALDMCMIARGSADVYWEIGLHAWDMAAGALMVLESGGYLCGDEVLRLGRASPSRDELHQAMGVGIDLLGRKVLAIRRCTQAESGKVVEQLVLDKLLDDYTIERD
ncbi:hypothetical protein RI367_002137 [Sorochytrium milnesiophthora]